MPILFLQITLYIVFVSLAAPIVDLLNAILKSPSRRPFIRRTDDGADALSTTGCMLDWEPASLS